MGKKKSKVGVSVDNQAAGAATATAKPTACLLRVPMHCRCDGCTDKIRAGVKDLTLHYGIQALDQSALSTKGELKVLLAAGDGDPDRLRRRLRKSTGKNVDLVLLPLPLPNKQDNAAADEKLLLQALLRGELQPAAAQYGHGHAHALQGAWGPGGHHQVQVLPPTGYALGVGAATPQQLASYPWGVQLQLQHQAADQVQAYPAYHPAAYPAAYAYPHVHGLGAYGGGGGWPGHGAY